MLNCKQGDLAVVTRSYEIAEVEQLKADIVAMIDASRSFFNAIICEPGFGLTASNGEKYDAATMCVERLRARLLGLGPNV